MSKSIRKAWRGYRALPRVPRELATLGLMLLVAVTVLPLAIWSAGRLVFGEYLRAPPDPAGAAQSGGPLALLVDFVGGILSGSPGHWLALLGPWLLLLLFRACRALAARTRS